MFLYICSLVKSKENFVAKPSASAILELHIRQMRNFMGFTVAFLKKKNPIKLMIEGTTAYFQNLLTINQKLTRINNRINYERYKLKKTELILAQNSEHVFLKGRQINQTR